jgi:hypothetical protein
MQQYFDHCQDFSHDTMTAAICFLRKLFLLCFLFERNQIQTSNVMVGPDSSVDRRLSCNDERPVMFSGDLIPRRKSSGTPLKKQVDKPSNSCST